MRSGYDAIQADGQRIEFGGRRRILLQRPDRFRVEAERSDGDRGLILFDGRAITAFRAEDNVYARVEKPGTLDDAMVYMVRDLQMTLPMARMFLTGFPQDLEKLITSIRYVEENFLFDVPTDHLAVRSAEVDLQVWIAQGDRPLPRRVVITYKNEPGQPQFRADFSNWDLSAQAYRRQLCLHATGGSGADPAARPCSPAGFPAHAERRSTMTFKSPAAALLIGAMFLLVTTLAGMAEARGGGGRGGGGGGGGRGGGGGSGFSRSSAASGGSFSSRSASQRSAQPSTRQTGTVQRSAQQSTRQTATAQRPAQPPTRQAGTSQLSTQQASRQESASQRQGQRQGTASEMQGQRQEAAGELQGNREDYRGESREDWQEHQNQDREDWQDQQDKNREDRQDFYEDEYHGGDWDDHWNDHDDGDVAAAFVVGAAVGVTAGAVASSVTAHLRDDRDDAPLHRQCGDRQRRQLLPVRDHLVQPRLPGRYRRLHGQWPAPGILSRADFGPCHQLFWKGVYGPEPLQKMQMRR